MAVVAPLPEPSVDPSVLCRHCGDPCDSDAIVSVDGRFCCRGCESVYSILKAHQLEGFYTCDLKPGLSQKDAEPLDASRFAALDDPQVAAAFVQFDDGRMARGVLPIPAIHCARCGVVPALRRAPGFPARALESG